MAEPGSTSKRTATLLAGQKLGDSSQRPATQHAGAPAVLPEPGRIIAEKYRIDQLLAQGGMGAVYAATHVVSGKRVALKWMLPSLSQVPGASERFVREARATARIDHPNVVDVYDVGDDDGSLYLVMEFLHGETLLHRLSRAPIAPRNAVALLMPALRGVAAAHAHGVIHRDLKPDNIFLCQSPDGELREPKVLDFGISKIASSDELRDHALTHSGMVMGTPYYMSPEQVRGANAVDVRSDVYAFGVILYEMLTGQRPFEAETYNQLIFKIATEDPPPITAVNRYVEPALVAIVERAMARSPDDRFQTVAALGLALEPHAGGVMFRPASSVPGELEPAFTPAPNARRAGRSPTRPSRQALWLVTAVGLAAAISGALLWRYRVAASAELSPTQTTMHAITAAPPRAEPTPAPRPTTAGSEDPEPQHVVAPQAPSAGASALPAAASQPNSDLPRVAAPSDDARPVRAARSTKNEPHRALAADWDERLPAAPAGPRKGTVPSAAGRISPSDLR